MPAVGVLQGRAARLHGLAFVGQAHMSRGRSQQSITGLRVLDALNGFTANQAEDSRNHAENLPFGYVDAVRGHQAEDSRGQRVHAGRMSLEEVH